MNVARAALRAICLAAVCLVGLPGLVPASAQAPYPNRPIMMIVPFAAGSTDSIARMVGARFSELLGAPVVIENRPGANGVVASGYVAQQKPDGYVIQLCLNSTHGLNTLFMKNVPFDPFRDFTMIGGLASSPYALVAHPSVPARTMKEVLDFVKAKPRQAHVGSGGVGSQPHLAVELLNQRTRLGFVHLPYRGGGPALTAALAGEVQFLFATTGSIDDHVKAGRLKLIALMGDKRIAALPDLEAIGETVPGFDLPDALFGLCGPAGLPDAIVSKLGDALGRSVSAPDVKARLEAFGMTPAVMSPTDFRRRMEADFAAFKRVTTAAGIQPE